MSGIISALGTSLNVFEAFSESDGSAKGLIKTLRGNKVKLVKADGSMLKILDKYIVEPVIIIDKDLKDLDELEELLGLHIDLFTGFYMQTFEIMTSIMGEGNSTVIDTLATDNGGLTRALLSGAELALEAKDENGEPLVNYLNDLLKVEKLELSTEARKLRYHSSLDSDATGRNKDLWNRRALQDNAFASKVRHDYNMSKLNNVYKDAELSTKQKHALELNKDKHESSKDLEALRHELSIKRDRLNTLKESAKAELGNGQKELFIPSAMMRNIEITVEGEHKDGRRMMITIPITIKADVLFVDGDSIVNLVNTHSTDNSFMERLDEYRSGGISFTDLVFATDLIKEYKKNKLRDKEKLIKLVNSRALSANSKIIDNGYVGFEKYYNMYIVDTETKAKIERVIRGKISNDRFKAKFLESAYGLSITTVDTSYERISIFLKDIRSKSELTFKSLRKSNKNGNDIGEVVKALMASKPPVF